MNKIEELLSIIDKRERHTALVAFAKKLGVDCAEARDRDKSGEFIEEKLVLLIYDALQQSTVVKKKEVKVLAGVIALAVVISAMVSLGTKMLVQIYKDAKNNELREEEVVQGYDKAGKPLKQDGQPVLFKKMSGEFQKFYNNGHLHFDYTYKNGKLLKLIEYSKRGEVIRREYFPENE